MEQQEVNEKFTAEQKLKIRDSFDDPCCSRAHGSIVVAELLAAMIASGKYDFEEYPRLVEEAFKLNALLTLRFDDEAKRKIETPKPLASELENSDFEACDPIPF